MPTSTYVALATTTLSGDAANVTFSSIPADYRDLILVINSISDSADDVNIQFNADTGSNYYQVSMIGYSGGTVSQALGPLTSIQIGFNANGLSTNILQIMDYSATDKHTTVLSRGNQLGSQVAAYAGRWANTAAVTSIKVTGEGSADFKTGTTMSLFGIAS